MNVNADIGGRSPLHYAADFGQTEVLQYLVSKGANANAKDKHGITVILAAIWEGHTDCVKFLIQKVFSDGGNEMKKMKNFIHDTEI